MTPVNVRDVVDPTVFHAFQIFGYSLFAFIGVFLCFATRRAILDARSAIARLRDRAQRPLTPKAAMRSESPVPARRDPVKVLAFVPARRTRNRVVVR